MNVRMHRCSLVVLVLAASLAASCRKEGEQEAPGEDAPAPQVDVPSGPRMVSLTAEHVRELGVAVQAAGPGSVRTYVHLSGEVVFDPERLAHVVPTVAGIVREVRATLGAKVRSGEVLAVLESRDLAEAKAAYLARRSRVDLAQRTFERESKLRESRVSSEQDFLGAQQALDEARIDLRAALHQLQALGVSTAQAERLAQSESETLSRYEMRSPLDGIVIEKHATRGEALEASSEAFTIADPSAVWIYFTVFAKDLPLVTAGKKVTLEDPGGIEATIDYVSPMVDEETRTTKARVVLPNADLAWRPGTFVTGRVLADEVRAPVVIPATSVQSLGDETIVFVQAEGGFEARPIHVGRRSETDIEITGGLTAGEKVVSAGAFALKSELEKAQFEEE